LRRGCGAWGWKSTSRRFAITDAEVLPELTGEDLKDIGIAAAIAASCFKPSQHCAKAPRRGPLGNRHGRLPALHPSLTPSVGS
jgi:hypothetical protein